MFDMLNADAETLAALPSLTEHIRHSHSTDTIVGYVVRQSVVEGQVARALYPHRPGSDVAVYRRGNLYAAALTAAQLFRDSTGYAVVDCVYSCGCRS